MANRPRWTSGDWVAMAVSAGVVVLIAAIVAGVIAVVGGSSAASAVTLEPAAQVGVDPFTASVAIGPAADFPGNVRAVAANTRKTFSTDPKTHTLIATATTPGLYGGSGDARRLQPATGRHVLGSEPAESGGVGERSRHLAEQHRDVCRLVDSGAVDERHARHESRLPRWSRDDAAISVAGGHRGHDRRDRHTAREVQLRQSPHPARTDRADPHSRDRLARILADASDRGGTRGRRRRPSPWSTPPLATATPNKPVAPPQPAASSSPPPRTPRRGTRPSRPAPTALPGRPWRRSTGSCAAWPGARANGSR